jgi:formylglycine-generating enzyme required for sulfatase activity
LKGRRAEEEGDLDAALRHYEEAYVKLPDFEEARERRQALLQAFRQREDALRQAQTELQQGAGLRDFADAEPHLQRAVMLAEAILAEDPGRAGAEAVLREATWRLDAGADMVFFKLSDGRAFAIDRYEYPNRKGEVPQTATFFEARRIASEIGKRLPTPDQWRLAAQGQATRTRRYPWGAAFEARRCHSSVGARRHKPAPSGSHPMGATPRGVHDLAGNLAEWVDRGEPEDADTAYAMGGHFATEDPDDLTSTSIEAIQNPGFSKRTTGFRCVKVYRADE